MMRQKGKMTSDDESHSHLNFRQSKKNLSHQSEIKPQEPQENEK